MTIEIHDYQESWPADFARIQAALAAALGELALRIDHIGSTSVPGLGAKDVIDVQVAVAALTNEVRDRLLAAGFRQSRPDARDHVPRGEDEDPVYDLIWEAAKEWAEATGWTP